MKLDVKAFAITAGIFWGLFLLIITWWIILLDGASGDITFIGKVYRGYNISIPGSFIGLAWGLVDGTIIGALFAFAYNFFSGRFSGKQKEANQ